MTMPLTPNELQALDRKVGGLNHELAEIASLLRSRYGETDELAGLAKSVQADFLVMSHQLHRRTVAARAEPSAAQRSQTA